MLNSHPNVPGHARFECFDFPSFSVERNGLDTALDRALAARTSCGAVMPDRAALLERLREAYRTRPLAAS